MAHRKTKEHKAKEAEWKEIRELRTYMRKVVGAMKMEDERDAEIEEIKKAPYKGSLYAAD